MRTLFFFLALFLQLGCNQKSGDITIGRYIGTGTKIPCDSCNIITSDIDGPHYAMTCEKDSFKLYVFFYSSYFDNVYCSQDSCDYPFETKNAKMILYNGEAKYYGKFNYFKSPIFVTKNDSKRDKSNIYDILVTSTEFINDVTNDTLIVSIKIKNIERDEYYRFDN